MIIDNKGRLFGKLNLLDLLFVLLFIAIIAAAGIIFSGGETTKSSTMPITYTVEIQNQDAAYFEHVTVGEQVTDGVTKAPMGEIIALSKEPAKVVAQANDKMVLVNPEGRYDGFVQIQADASVSYPNLLLNDNPIKIGTSLALRSETLAMHGYVVAIDYDAEQFKGAK